VNDFPSFESARDIGARPGPALRGPAFGRPGIAPRWTSSSKSGVGTAFSPSSRVWLTLSHGILNEVYYPTLDRPQIRDLQFLVSDGETFFHEERRHLEARIECLEGDTLGYRVLSSDPEGRYRLVKEIIADPHQPCVLIHARIEVQPEWQGRLQLHALLAPHLEGGGWGNSARRLRTVGKEILIAWKGRTCLALGADCGFSRTSCGFVGVSDGWQDLNDNFRLDWEIDSAEDGNIAVIGQIDIAEHTEFTLGLAFGDGLHAALTTLMQSLAVPYAEQRATFVSQWRQGCCDILNLEKHAHDDGVLYRVSHNLLLAHEDKTFTGAIIASASIPWGETKGDEDLGGYHLVWTRDMVNSAMALLACGAEATPRRALVYLACSQRPDGGFAQNFWLDGTPYWTAIQLDQVALPILLAWRLWRSNGLDGLDPYPMVRAAAAFLVRQGPMTEQERWEEASGYSPSTLAVSIAALLCAADFARARAKPGVAGFLEDYADFMESHLERWTVTTQGSLVPGIPRHYIRIHPTAIDDPAPDEDPNAGMLVLANQPPDARWCFPAKDIVDAGFLELVRYGIRKPRDPLIEDSLAVVDALLKVETPFGPCWRRYNHDGYGNRPDGGPFLGWGKSGAWPLLTGERAHYELAAGRDVTRHVLAMEGFAFRGGMLPEQVWDESRPERKMYLGRPTGSAMPLMWAHAEYIKLLRALADGEVFDRIPLVADRYLGWRGRKDLEIWKPIRRVRTVAPGQTLRVMSPAAFRLHWTLDEWQTVQDTPATPSGLGIYFVDIPIAPSQRAPVRFTFFWLESAEFPFFRCAEERWEGRDYMVEIN
jgi:glucoamylase